MRHFGDRLGRDGITLHYHKMTEDGRDERGEGFAAVLRQDMARLRPQRFILVRPGDYRVLTSLEKEAAAARLPLELRQDSHFFSTVEEFLAFAGGKRDLLLEGFYRFMRRRHRIPLSPDGKPSGGRWNFDKENRRAFGSWRPALDYRPTSFPPDETTREVIRLVAARFGDHPGALGMSQYGDGGIVGTKPYCASGNYINRMSNYCGHCPYRPGKATGDHACPFTTLYWKFLDRHFDLLKENARLKFQIPNARTKRNDKSLIGKIRKRADLLRWQWGG